MGVHAHGGAEGCERCTVRGLQKRLLANRFKGCPYSCFNYYYSVTRLHCLSYPHYYFPANRREGYCPAPYLILRAGAHEHKKSDRSRGVGDATSGPRRARATA
jgi:hypothetical protein